MAETRIIEVFTADVEGANEKLAEDDGWEFHSVVGHAGTGPHFVTVVLIRRRKPTSAVW